MTGTISNIKKWKGGYFFIEGDDGVNYFSHMKFVVDAKKKVPYKGSLYKLWDICAYEGNKVEFDVTTNPETGEPRAINVVLDKVADPDFLKKAQRRAEDKAARERHERNRQLHEEREKRAALKRKNRELMETLATQGYVIQERHDGEWKTIYQDGDQAVYAESVEQAKEKLREIMHMAPGFYRMRKAKLYRNYGSKRVIVRVEP